MKRLMALMTAVVACGCGEVAERPTVKTTAQGIEAAQRCAPLGVDLVPDGAGVVVHGALDLECAGGMVVELLAADGRLIAQGEMPVEPETGRFGVRLEYLEEPPMGEPLILRLQGGEAFEEIELRAEEGPDGIELVAPVPEAPDGMSGEWMLSARQPGTTNDTAPTYARIFQDGQFIELVDLCDPERRIGTGWIEGEQLTLFDESGNLLAEGSASPYHMQAFRESGEDVYALEAVRLESFGCDTGKTPVQATPFMPRQRSELTEWTGLNPFNGYITEVPNGVLERFVQWAGYGGVLVPLAKPNGMDHLMAAAKTPWPAAKRNINEQTLATECVDPANNNATIPCPASSGGTAAYQECAPKRVTGQDVMELANRVLLTPDNDVYPGALIQGRTLENGNFAPINVPRSGSTLTMSGVTMANPNITVNAVDFASVEQARQSLIQRPISSTAGRLAITTHTVSSFDDLLVKAGAHIKWGTGSFKTKFSFQNNSKLNSVLVKFDQELYRLTASRPARAVAAFRDGGQFNDPNFNIGAHNRPVFVSEVGYGRQLFLLVQSKHTTQDIKASLSLAVSNSSGSASVKQKQVLDGATISFVALGGDAQLAAGPLAAIGSKGNVYKAVADTAANLRGLSTSPNNAAVPVAFTLTDLLRGDKLRSAYSVSHTRRDCVAKDGRPFEVKLDLRSVNEELRLWFSAAGVAKQGNPNRSFSLFHPTWRGYTRPGAPIDLTADLSANGQARRLTLEHNNFGCFYVWADIGLSVNGRSVMPRYKIPASIWSGHCGVYWTSEIEINTATGAHTIISSHR